jgi:hypothetical protein
MKSKLFSGIKQFWQLNIYKPVLEANYFVAQLANSLSVGDEKHGLLWVCRKEAVI